MTTEITPQVKEDQAVQVQYRGGSSGTVYALGLIGAWVFYIGRATTFSEGLLGFLKGFAWPAFLVYDLLAFLNRE